MPVRPSSVLTSTSVFICSSGSLPPGQPVSWVPPESGIVRTSVIFIGLLVSRSWLRSASMARRQRGAP